MKRLRAVLLGVCAVVASVSPVRGSEVVLVTSLPKELFEGEKKAFEATPGVKVVVKQRTNQGVTYLRETRAKPDADLCDRRQKARASWLADACRHRGEPIARAEFYKTRENGTTLPPATWCGRIDCGCRSPLWCIEWPAVIPVSTTLKSLT